MNIKAFIKKNILAALAVALITGFSAFKMAEAETDTQAQSMLWYPVESNGDIQSNNGSSTPSDQCEDENLLEVCEIQLSPNPDGSAPVIHLSETAYEGGSEPNGAVRFREPQQ